MTKPKTLDQLRAERERAETQLAQEKHKLERLENRKYLEKANAPSAPTAFAIWAARLRPCPGGQRSHTHRNDRADGTHLSLSEVQRAVRHMAITHTNQANRKGLKADGTISSERHAD